MQRNDVRAHFITRDPDEEPFVKLCARNNKRSKLPEEKIRIWSLISMFSFFCWVDGLFVFFKQHTKCCNSCKKPHE